ncbi:MAG TPA: tetratricopeptide repeat protein [Chloroflexota bacterium]|jgi:tetratricopeptide (TPR) repeat protein|nr:tetratricopeptide repeat protein [Chloroflexota bacterium]
MLSNTLAIDFNQRGETFLFEQADFRQAEEAFRRSAASAPFWSVPWFNLGLVFKWQRLWRESLDCNQKALERDRSLEGAWWNLGISATALGNWPEARRAWTGFGLELPPGEGEILMNLGPTPIRLDPAGTGEVVWCERIDPARATIRSVPLPKTGHRFGDLLLHDGAPSGERLLHGETVPVFNAIELLRPSTYLTFEVELRAPGPEALRALFRRAANEEIGLEDWDTLRCLCSACSQGSPGPSKHDDFVAPEHYGKPIRLMAAAPDEDRIRAFLHAWTDSDPGGSILRVAISAP